METVDEPVDVTVLEALIDVRKQQELVQQLCERADKMKSGVAPAVYDRVMADYATRREALERDAAPLVTRALAEYRKLRRLHDGVQRDHDAARLDKDEIEFRHSLGEIDDATRDERLREPDRALAESAAELAKLDAQDARFREALPDAETSLAEAAEPEEAPATPAAVEEPASAEEPQPASAASIGDENTVWLSDLPQPIPFPQRGASEGGRISGGAAAAVAFAPVPPLPVDADAPVEGAPASLVSESDEGRSVNYQLTALTYIGRAEDNQIRILDPGISRRHVLITGTADGYTIRDLKSQNGTYLNGERINETSLADGDRITLGEVTLIFRRPAAEDLQTGN